jgi:hypothetical protein
MKRMGQAMSSSAPLQVHPTKLAQAGVTMGQVVQQLNALKTQIGGPCRLPVLALSPVGEPARLRFDGDCTTAGKDADSLGSTAQTMSKNLVGNAVGYISVEQANIAAIEKAAQGSDVASDDANVGEGGARAVGVAGTVKMLEYLGINSSQFKQMEEMARQITWMTH